MFLLLHQRGTQNQVLITKFLSLFHFDDLKKCAKICITYPGRGQNSDIPASKQDVPFFDFMVCDVTSTSKFFSTALCKGVTEQVSYIAHV